MLNHTDLDPPKRVHHLALMFAISSGFIENESRFLINFTITTNQVQFNYGHHSPRVSSYVIAVIL